MGAAVTATIQYALEPVPQRLTLLELVRAVGEVTADDREVVATVLHMLHTGSVELQGSFKGRPAREFRD